MSGLLGAVAFLTRIGVPRDRSAPGEVARSVPWFPVVGALVGVVVAGLYAIAALVLPALAAAGAALAAGVLVTGAFHEDGLADVADAFGGGWDRAGVVRILADPRLGTFGVVALVLSLVVRAGAIASLEWAAALAIVPSAHALSRSGAIALMGALPSAAEGLGASYARSVTPAGRAAGVASGVLLAALLLGPVVVVVALATVALGAAVVARLALRKIGGITGDVLGAAQQVGEIGVLLVGAAAASGDWAQVPWWG